MRRTCFLLVLPILLGQAPPAKDDVARQQAEKAKRVRLLEIYRAGAAKYTIYRDSSHREKVELKPEPVYVWTNPLRHGGQDGALFVWTCRGRAEVIASIFSDPAVGPRKVNHELQSLSLSTLDVSRSGTQSWTPEGPGITSTAIANAPIPAGTEKALTRRLRIRALNGAGSQIHCSC